MEKSEKDSKSPIKAPLLRYPAQSLDEEIERVIQDEFVSYVYYAATFGAIAIFEWWRWLTNVIVHPSVPTALFLVAATISYRKFRTTKKKIRALNQGRDGERAVGQYLDTLVDIETKVFHDIVVDDFNIDHIVISSKGVFAIETKTYSKPARGAAVIRHRDNTLTFNDKSESKSELVQAKAGANWLRNFFQETLRRDLTVKPVLFFPGWYIENEGSNEVWILEPKAFPKYLNNRKPVFERDEVMTLSTALSRYIRDSAKFNG